MHDLVIRGGTVVDGTGAPAVRADVAVDGERVVAVGADVGRGRREVDAEGRHVLPGWVDVHSHYDGQATWDPLLAPSGPGGVTTTVMGNCGVGFAPVRPADHQALITLMEGVEDVPGTALWEGLPWTWETFPEYLDSLAAMPRVLDVAALLPHSAVRAYVMGAEESVRGVATEAQTAEMAQIVAQSVAAGAIGLSTSRTKLHLAADGSPVPGSFVEIDELLALAHGVAAGGGGMLQLVTDWSRDDPAREFAWMRRLAEESGQPLSFSLAQFDETPRHHERLLSLLAEARADGVAMHAGVGSRPVGMLIDLESRIHPFSHRPTYRALAELPVDERRRRMRDPQVRTAVLAEESEGLGRFWAPRMRDFANMYPLGDPPDYEPPASRSVEALANGRTPDEVAYDLMTEGTGWLYFPFINYSDGSLDAQLQMMRHPATVLSLADGGAHCGLICDATAPTFQLTHWVRDRDRGERLGLEEAVHLQTGRTAALWGLADRGVLAPGMRADLNVVDLDALRLLPPRWTADLPAGGRRLLQDVEGYDATFLAGRMTWSHGEPTGERPGRVVRTARPPATV
ncbi:amidohydrolase family protein [Blastococcus sp. URHD0036]|uniref:N-acyl-D-amino-acid deacylase family protein n=1 Tax=Blastococcus sp. URHD0036 TaxID=1380356 RepID=UPI0004953F5F|nr:amidohydrolase family protein [Blastococcus sp. URHD0036]